MRVWELEPGRLMVTGAFSDLALHHHPAIQITVGGHGPLSVTGDDDALDTCRLVVIASGARHAVRSDSCSEALTLYLGLQTPQGSALNTLARNHPRGIWIVNDAGPAARVPQLRRHRRPVRRGRERGGRRAAGRARREYPVSPAAGSR